MRIDYKTYGSKYGPKLFGPEPAKNLMNRKLGIEMKDKKIKVEFNGKIIGHLVLYNTGSYPFHGGIGPYSEGGIKYIY